MPFPPLFILVLHIITYLINTVGASTVDSLLWLLYIKLPNQTSRTASEQRRLKREVLQLKRELNATSSQDEFAKWAKLRRRHDKAMEEYDSKNKALAQDKGSFDLTVKTVRWVGTIGLKFFLQFYYSKQPMFALPPGWFPWQIEWLLSFPRAPLGTVSIQVWGGACGTAVSTVGDVVVYMVAHFRRSGQHSMGGAKPQKRATTSKDGKEALVSEMKTE
ncbi:hypothetical protein VTO42DRAFT_6282 [Malbranchea cinnamomea]